MQDVLVTPNKILGVNQMLNMINIRFLYFITVENMEF